VPHAVATPEALPLVTDSTPAPGPSAEQKIRLSLGPAVAESLFLPLSASV